MAWSPIIRSMPQSKKEAQVGRLLQQLMPEELLKFGVIPEFIGRLPIVVTLDALDELALRRILVEPRNALVRQFQFQKIIGMNGVDLTFTKEALNANATKAQGRKTGARGLRSILEEVMLDVMYDLPSLQGVKKCVINKEVIDKNQEPKLIYADRPKGLPAKRTSKCSRSRMCGPWNSLVVVRRAL
jgi:ATP-dependent Clp protease ATP-binding subunit ClpX